MVPLSHQRQLGWRSWAWLLLGSQALIETDAFLNLGQLDYSNLGGHGPDVDRPQSMRYKDVAAVGGKFTDLLIETQTGYSPFDPSQNAASGKGDQVGNINVRVGTSLEARFRFVEGSNDKPMVADRFFFTVYLSDKREQVRVQANATGPVRSAGLGSFCVADGSALDLRVHDESKTIVFAPRAAVDGVDGAGQFEHNPSVFDPYELGAGLRRQTFTLSFVNVSEFVLSVDVAGMVGEDGANFMFSGTASVEDICLPWVGGDGLYFDYVKPGPPSPMPMIVASALGGTLSLLLLVCAVRSLAGRMQAMMVKRDRWEQYSLGDARETSRVDSVTPLMPKDVSKPVYSNPEYSEPLSAAPLLSAPLSSAPLSSNPLPSTAPSEVVPAKFHVTVLKTAQRSEIGLRIKTLDDCIMVRGIGPEGLVSDWNTDIPDKEVKVDDFIIEVNGSKGTGEFLEQALTKDKAVKLTILRDEAKAKLVNSLVDAEPAAESSVGPPVQKTPSNTTSATATTNAQSLAMVPVQPLARSSTMSADRKLAEIKSEEKERLEGMLAKNQFQKNSKQLRRTKTLLSTVEGELGNPRRQVEILEESLAELEEEVGPDDPEVAQLLTNLANAHANLGDAPKQKELLQRALVIKENKFGPNDRRLAVTLTSLGDALGSLGEKEEQMRVLERALQIKEEAYGKDHHEVSVTLANLGIAHRRVGEPQKALELFERSIDIKEKEYGRDHPKVALTLGNMAQAHGDLGNYRTQRELLERSLHIFETNFGPDHPHTALARQALGAVKRTSGQKGSLTARSQSTVR